MKVGVRERPEAPAGGPGPESETYELVPYWGDSLRLLVHRGGRPVFACVAVPRTPTWWYLTDCLPQRDDPGTAEQLLRVCLHLFADRGATDVIAVHPESWAGALAAAGAEQLQRMVSLSLCVDAALLSMHRRPLPEGYRTEPLDLPSADPAPLAALSTAESREDDQRVWRETLSGIHGPAIAEASLRIVSDAGTRAAVVVTSLHGTPFVANLATAPGERGNGLGRAVLVDALLGLSGAGYADCALNVVEDNWVAHRMYRSVGFVRDRALARVSWMRRPSDA